jgi:hypothetical protein
MLALAKISSVEIERCLQLLQNPCGNHLAFVTSGRRLEQHGELVPEETGYCISWSHARLQAFGDLGE